jgi:putative two-component system response regulator
MVTSNGQRGLGNEALAGSVTDFLGKPFDAVEVRARVRNLLRLRRALRDLEDRSGWLACEIAAATKEIGGREHELVTRLVRATEHRDSGVQKRGQVAVGGSGRLTVSPAGGVVLVPPSRAYSCSV